MKTRGAILRKPPGAYEVIEVDLAEPLPGELMVKMVGSGLCHTDDHVATGRMPYGICPVCGGHDGAGIVTGPWARCSCWDLLRVHTVDVDKRGQGGGHGSTERPRAA